MIDSTLHQCLSYLKNLKNLYLYLLLLLSTVVVVVVFELAIGLVAPSRWTVARNVDTEC